MTMNRTISSGKAWRVLPPALPPEAFQQGENVSSYEEAPNLNRFATPGTPFAEKVITKNPQLRVKLAKSDITVAATEVVIEGYAFEPASRLTHTGELAAPTVTTSEEKDVTAYTMLHTWMPVENADYYEILFDSMTYSTIRDTELLFEDLQPETSYQFQLRAVNKEGHSDWTAFCFTTKSVPFDLVADLHAICQLDKFQYVPRENAGNGTLLKGTVSYSMDKQNWTEAGAFEWHRDAGVKVFTFSGQPTARYVRLHVTESVGNFGSGRELYIFKVPDTESYLPGDINHDRLLDETDLTSYTNYTGLRQGDADFEGYISNGDLNRNGLIDAYDISVVATALDGGIAPQRPDTLQGTVTLSTVKKSYQAGETIDIVVRGQGLNGVNALSFALPYDATAYEFAGIEAGAVSGMRNLTNDRLHTSGVKALYPTFVNIGDRETLKGDAVLFTIHLKAKKDVRFDLKAQDGMLVSKQLEYVGF